MIIFNFAFENVNKSLKLITPTILEVSYGLSIIIFAIVAYTIKN